LLAAFVWRRLRILEPISPAVVDVRVV
jgi:hypothetical protein